MSVEKTTATKKEWVRWVDKRLLISIEVPAHWTAYRNPRFELLLMAPGQAGDRPSLVVQKSEVAASDRSILDVVERGILDDLKPNKDFRLLDTQSITLDEIFQANLYRVGYTNSRGVRLVQWLMLVSGGKALFQVMATAPATEAEELQPLIQRIFSSVRFRLKRLAQANAALANARTNQE